LPKQKWVGLAPAFFGIMQAVGHGLVFPCIAGYKYCPGFLASFFLHVPSLTSRSGPCHRR
jgi:hypothetical protein